MITRVRFWLFLALLIVATMAAAACGDGSGTTDEDGTPPATAADDATPSDVTPPPAGEIITIEDILAKDGTATKTAEVEWGFMFELSGPLAGFGEPAGDGVLLAVQEINAAGGFQVGDTIYTIKLIEHDTESNVAKTIDIVTGLVRDNEVNVIFGPASIGDAEVTQRTQPRQILNICPCPEREITSLASVEKMEADARWAFQTLAAPSKFLPPGARNTAEEHPEFETFATICLSTQIGEAFCQFFEDAYSEAGFQHVGGRKSVPIGTSDFNPVLTSLRGDNPDIILNFVDAGVAQFNLLKQSWQLDVGQFYIGVAVPLDLFEALVGDGIRDKIVSAGAAPRTHAQFTSEKSRVFFEDIYTPFLEGGNLPFGAFAALMTYDPVYMLVAAMQRAGTVVDTTEIAEAMEQIHFSGFGEDDLFFDERHVIVTGNDTCTIFQGEMECVHVPPDP